MSEPAMGAYVQFCGHDGMFVADIWAVGEVNVVHAGGPVSPGNLIRPATGATHLLVDFPKVGFWKPRLGVFVVPKEQVRKLEGEKA